MIKVGVFTYLSLYCNFTNYGTVLQAWALQKALQKHFGKEITPVLIDYCPKAMSSMNPLRPMDNMWDKDTALRKQCEEILPDIEENYYKFKAFYHNRMQMTEKSYNEENIQNIAEEGISHFICGSDSIWDITEFGWDKCFYAQADNMRQRTIAYSPSFQDSFDVFFNNNTDLLIRMFNSFLAIGLREERSIRAMRQALDIPVKKTIDPTLLLDVSDYECITEDRIIKEKYLLYYSRRYNAEMEKTVKRIAKERNLKVVEISIRTANRGEHELFYRAGIEEFLSLIKYADYVITNSYHCLIFAIHYEKDFLVYGREHCNNKIQDLLHAYGLDDHFCYLDSSETKQEISYTDVKARLYALRRNSLEYLEDSVHHLLEVE